MKLDDFIDWSVDLLRNSQRGDLIFYEYAKTKLDEWTNQLKKVNKSDLRSCIKDETTTAIGTKSFYNLISHITKIYLKILMYAYQGDYYEAIDLLRKLFYKQAYTQYKLNDFYINYFKFSLITDTTQKFYRVVDFDKDVKPLNCNHVPFNKRNSARHNRFNIFGYPCLYLSTEKDNCIKEIGNLKSDKNRYYSEFVHKMQSYYFNLTIPANESQLDMYDKFSFIVTYPMLLMCLTIAPEVRQFEEEYLFPQLLFPAIFLNNINSTNYIGIAYNSVQDFKCINLAIPAKLNENEVIPPNNISEFIISKFNEIGPTLVESN